MGKAAKTFILICFLSLFFVMPVSAYSYSFDMHTSSEYFNYNPEIGVGPVGQGNIDISDRFVFSNNVVFTFAASNAKTVIFEDIVVTSNPVNTYFDDLTLCVVCDNQLYEFRPVYYASGSTYKFNPIYLPLVDYGDSTCNFTLYFRGYADHISRDELLPSITLTMDVNFSFSTEAIVSDSTDQLLQDQLDQDKEFHDQDKNDATTAGNDVTGAATELDNLKSKWEILWYPIEFTNNIMAAFSGSDNSRYRSRYAGVVGYSYDDSSGFLVPVYSTSTMAEGDIPESPGGTVITFPSYTLPVLNVKLWDSYSYDLSQITEQYPVLFNAIYVIITILEVYWFVGFLRDKYEEVFGK